MYKEPEIEERVDRLESLLGNFLVGTDSALKRLEREMRTFKNEMRQDRKEMNIQWGGLANKMGTIVEDIVAPAVCPAVQKYFHQEIDHFSIKVKRKSKQLGLKSEFDVIAANGPPPRRGLGGDGDGLL